MTAETQSPPFPPRSAKFLKGTVCALALVALAGCAPDLGPMAAPDDSSTLETSKSFAAPTIAWPSEDWWTAYNDPQLNTLVNDALQGSPDLKIAAARLKQAAAMGDVAEADLYPTISADASAKETEQSKNQGFPKSFKPLMPSGWHHSGSVTASISYELDFFGKNRANFAAALSDVQAAKADEAAARLSLSTGVVQAYAQLMQLFADKKTAERALQIREQSASLVEQRWKAQLDDESSYSQAQAQLKNARLQVKEMDRLIALTRNQIAALLGKGPDRGLSIQPTDKAYLGSVGLPEKLSADLIGRRPDIVAARYNVEAKSSRIDAANANFYPDINLVGTYGLQTFDLKYLAQASSEMGSFGPAIHLPIFDYGRNTGIYRGARAQYDEAVALYDKTLVTALRDVADAYGNRKSLDGELADARGAEKDAANSYRLVKARYTSGLVRYIDVLTVENQLLQAQRAVTDLDSQAFIYDVALVRALGGGYAAKR
ncbi:NodT family efflux transporter outer membrane factor (OMF) lipoprotein [Rhizomicrobium palustre]|uniref:NodT family efflux transporter outer membrane factor (OMF) lipoprotein n=1 Tax=Rhizomicrobium palustre TaxID=189966 RepID=A0A846MVA0_9PROT|nr:efflux transporter outer membrane subunit [Rhizomicrobium palustre]NIK87101.1 NodT family efflux transporter outer membrane factor (OMF) lipoprotein [Rhizomicrobium palustre]